MASSVCTFSSGRIAVLDWIFSSLQFVLFLVGKTGSRKASRTGMPYFMGIIVKDHMTGPSGLKLETTKKRSVNLRKSNAGYGRMKSAGKGELPSGKKSGNLIHVC